MNSNVLDRVRDRLKLFQLQLSIVYVTCLITMNSLLKKERMSHENGIGATGHLRIVDNPTYPRNDFFTAGEEFDMRLRHATVLYRDDAKLTVRGVSIKFANTRHEAPLDLLMNSGRVGLFFDARTFLQFMKGTMGGRGQRWLPYLNSRPQAMFGGGDSVRRNPNSFAEISYNSKTCYGYRSENDAGDDEFYYVRYRLIPIDWNGEDSGAPDTWDREHSWFQNPYEDEKRHRNYLKDEYRERVAAGPVDYTLQIQPRLRPDGERDPQWVASEYEWDADESPWHDLAAVTVTDTLSHEETQLTWFSLSQTPDCLPLPRGKSIDDPHSLVDLRLASDWARKARLFSYRFGGPKPGPGESRAEKDWIGVPPMAEPPGA